MCMNVCGSRSTGSFSVTGGILIQVVQLYFKWCHSWQNKCPSLLPGGFFRAIILHNSGGSQRPEKSWSRIDWFAMGMCRMQDANCSEKPQGDRHKGKGHKAVLAS